MTAIDYYNQEIKELFNQFQDGKISNNMFQVQRLVALTQSKQMEMRQAVNFAYDIADDLACGVLSKKAIEDRYNEFFKSE